MTSKLILILITGGCALLLISLMIWWDDAPFSNSDSIKIKYKDFMKYYSINPGRYDLREGYVYASIPCKSLQMITFGFFDYWRYKSFCKSRAKKKKMCANAKLMGDYLNVVMRDISDAQKIAKQETERAVKMIEQIHI